MARIPGDSVVAMDDVSLTVRCQTCDGLPGRFAHSDGTRGMPKRPLRLCPECGETASQCASCGEWLAPNWFREAKSVTCSACLAVAKARRPWTSAEGKRLYEASRRVLDFWPRYFDTWTDEDMGVWREFLVAMERIKSVEA